jgi:hypothetical protein
VAPASTRRPSSSLSRWLLEQQLVDAFFYMVPDELVLWVFNELSAALLALVVLLTVMNAAVFDDPLRSVTRARGLLAVIPCANDPFYPYLLGTTSLSTGLGCVWMLSIDDQRLVERIEQTGIGSYGHPNGL